jgi:hypothetical protein
LENLGGSWLLTALAREVGIATGIVVIPVILVADDITGGGILVIHVVAAEVDAARGGDQVAEM